jgi:hypothetical protein
MSLPRRDQLRDSVSRLVHCGLGVEEYRRAVSDPLDDAAPSEGSCLMTMDPATMLPTAEFVENGMSAHAISRLVEIELGEPDYSKWVDLARAGRTVASLSESVDSTRKASPQTQRGRPRHLGLDLAA